MIKTDHYDYPLNIQRRIVKGASVTLKKGMVIKNIRLTEDDGEIECPADKMKIVLKTMFLKKG